MLTSVLQHLEIKVKGKILTYRETAAFLRRDKPSVGLLRILDLLQLALQASVKYITVRSAVFSTVRLQFS
jgi:hypothetical protein